MPPAGIESRIQALGGRLLDATGHAAEVAGSGWLDVLMERAVRDPGFRLQTLRFIDVLPVLTDDAVLVAHLQDYFADVELPWPSLSRWSLRHSDAPWAVSIAAPLVRATLRGLSRRFMGGNTLPRALHTLAKLEQRGMRCSLDLLGEAVLSEREADAYQQAYLGLLAGLPQAGAGTASPEISLKLTSLATRIHPADPR
ncbi:MAG: proline dehydrogenase family protein, partial [Gammaproteobacteria bacterium]